MSPTFPRKSPRNTLFALALIVFAIPQASQAEETICPYTKKDQKEVEYPFLKTNKLFLENYAQAKKEIRGSLGPVIICTGDSITLLKNGKSETKKFIEYKYTTLKQVAHITLSTYTILINHCDQSLSEDTSKRLKQLKSAIEEASKSIKSLSLSDQDKEDQKKLCDKSIAFIDTVIEKNSVSREELRKYTRSVSALTLENAYGAASDQLSKIDSIVKDWLSTMTEEEIESLHVIVQTGHMPRERQSSLQYFQYIFQDKKPGKRIITIETMKNQEEAISLLLTHILDEKVAVDFYADSWRMHRDLLSDGAAKYIKKNKPARIKLK